MADDAVIEFREYSDHDLPEVLQLQVLCFLRIVWPDGFAGPNRFRHQITDPELHPRHLLYSAGSQLVSHLELITTMVSVNHRQYRVQSPTSVLTYPAFRGEGWSTRLNLEAAARIDSSGADIGVLMCGPDLIDFYRRAGWTHAVGARIVAGPDGATWTSQDVLMTRPTSPNSSKFVEDLDRHSMRVATEW